MISWMITSSVLIAVVLLLRRVLKGRVSQRLQYLLWLPVLVRLLIPFSFGSSKMSVLNTLPTSAPSSVAKQKSHRRSRCLFTTKKSPFRP